MRACISSRGFLRGLVLCGVVGLLGAASSAQAKTNLKPCSKVTPTVQPVGTSVPLPAAAWSGLACAAMCGVVAVRRRKANVA